MKSLILTTLFALTPLTLADISYGSPAPAPAAKEYAQLANDVISTIKEMTQVLESITDQASADAAAPQLSSTTARLLELQRKTEEMPRPTNEVEQLVRSNTNIQEIQQLVGDFLNACIRIAINNAYGSQGLMDALGPIMNCAPGMQD